MVTRDRKQRERQERDQLIRETGRRLVLAEGYHGLTMDKLAAEIEYSKGTLYQHFPNKEALIMALAADATRKKVALFERAATFTGRARERMAAIGVANDLFARLFADDFQLAVQLCSSPVLEKATPEQQSELDALQMRLREIMAGLVRDGVAAGDLQAGPRELDELLFGLWSLTLGATTLDVEPILRMFPNVQDAQLSARRNAHRLLDGFGWRPLWPEHDWDSVYARIEGELFAGEHAALRRRRR